MLQEETGLAGVEIVGYNPSYLSVLQVEDTHEVRKVVNGVLPELVDHRYAYNLVVTHVTHVTCYTVTCSRRDMSHTSVLDLHLERTNPFSLGWLHV